MYSNSLVTYLRHLADRCNRSGADRALSRALTTDRELESVLGDERVGGLLVIDRHRHNPDAA
jgi:hypothetical protein